MSYWQMLDGATIQGIALEALAQQHGTPLYIYDGNGIQRLLQAYRERAPQAKIHYAVKANSNLSILAKMAQWGAGFDIVSQGELMRVLQAGGRADSVVFSGVGKTAAEMEYALAAGIACFNVESEEELWLLAATAQQMGKKAPIALRVNPGVDARTHPYISTGMKDNKFGIAIDDAAALYRRAAEHPALQICGIGCHIGSQITTLEPFREAAQSVKALADSLRAEQIPIHHIDMGGGLGVATETETEVPTPQALVQLYVDCLRDSSYALHLQPGRSLVGNQGILLSRVLGVKEQSAKRFVIIDAAMNDYIRPALYQVVVPLRSLPERENPRLCDIVGPVCETGDTIRRAVNSAAVSGDLLLLGGVGAYGMSMSSQYNSRPRAAEVMILDGQAKLIRRREEYKQLWENETGTDIL